MGAASHKALIASSLSIGAAAPLAMAPELPGDRPQLLHETRMLVIPFQPRSRVFGDDLISILDIVVRRWGGLGLANFHDQVTDCDAQFVDLRIWI